MRTQRHRLDAGGALFDLDADPGQRRDVSAEYPAVVQRLTATRTEVADAVGFGRRGPDRPFAVGAADTTSLPARDGVAHGGLQRSSVHPNDSYFLQWTSPAHAATWDVDVLEAGDYEVLAWYAVPASDVGATVRVTFDAATSAARKR